MNLTYQNVEKAYENVSKVARKTPLEYSSRLSNKYGAKVYLKREDLQPVRSYKLRGAYNFISQLNAEERKRGVVCASAGNHAQGVAYSCALLKIKGAIFMPEITPRQKIDKVRTFGGKYVEIILTGRTFDEAFEASLKYGEKHKLVCVRPFNDPKIIEGQATVAYEIDQDLKDIDYVFAPIGGGGLISGISMYNKTKKTGAKIIGVDPLGAPKMVTALKAGKPVMLEKIDTFIDGAAVKCAGDLTFSYIKKYVDKVITAAEGAVCKEMIDLYQSEGIITEPAGALSVAALAQFTKEIKGKTVVCIISGGNNDISRYPEIAERSLMYQGLKRYFIVEFAQRPGELKKFLDKVLGPNDDIVRFEYIKKTNKEKGPALVGLELSDKDDYPKLLARFDKFEIKYKVISSDDMLYQYIV
jgi:threonine dehydratase